MKTQNIKLPSIKTVMGVDFSGAAKSGKLAWIAELKVTGRRQPLSLGSLRPIGRLAGSDRREDVCNYLVERILSSRQVLWGMDFPFGLPVELGLGGWRRQLRHVCEHDPLANGGNRAIEYGRYLVELSDQLHGTLHIRRQTDRETQTPFDCYHYRIIFQTFHGMRDVLSKIAEDPATATLPFDYPKVAGADRLVVEACPASTLKRLGLPHAKYKQTGGKPPTQVHRRARRSILRGILQGHDRALVRMSDHRRRLIMNDPGADALDAVLAGVGSWHSIRSSNHDAITRDPRYPLEGRVYC